jgi:hypothetical protein
MGKFKVGDRVLDISDDDRRIATVYAVRGDTVQVDWHDGSGSPEGNAFWPEEDFALIEEPATEKVENTIKVGSLVRIKHTDYGDTIKVGSLRRVSEVDDDGVSITVFSEEFNSDIQLYFYFHEVE